MKKKIKIRRAKIFDVPRLLEIDKEIWPDFRATEEMFRSRIETFPEGQFVALVDGQVVGSVFTQLINYNGWKDRNFTWNEITDSGTIRQTHNPNGDSVYGVGLAVVREFQNTAVSSFLIIEAGRLTIQKNYRQLLIGARIPAYHKHQDIPVDEYIKITRGGSRRFFDPELAIYQKYKGIPIKVLQNYMYDPESLNFGVLVSFKNPFYNSPFRKIVALVLRIRPEVCW